LTYCSLTLHPHQDQTYIGTLTLTDVPTLLSRALFFSVSLSRSLCLSLSQSLNHAFSRSRYHALFDSFVHIHRWSCALQCSCCCFARRGLSLSFSFSCTHCLFFPCPLTHSPSLFVSYPLPCPLRVSCSRSPTLTPYTQCKRNLHSIQQVLYLNSSCVEVSLPSLTLSLRLLWGGFD